MHLKHLPIAALTASAALLPGAAHATDEETQFWIDATISYDLSDDLSISTQINPRIQLDETAADQFFLRGGLDYRVSDFVRVGGGMIWLGEFGPTETRPYNYVDLGDGPLTFRTMAEYRFFDGADQMELRLRQRAQLSQPVAQDTNLVLSGEVFYTAQTRDESGDDSVTQWRAIAGVSQQLNETTRMSFAYMALGSPRANAEDSLAHIPTLGLNYSF